MDVVECALRVLNEPEADRKAALSAEFWEVWQQGRVSCQDLTRHAGLVPDRPARSDDKVRLVQPWELKRGKGGSLASRQALLHSLVHIENWAVDLAWDVVARFGPDADYRMPPAFFADFVKVAEDEARHYALLARRLEAVGSHYGAFPSHDGLWISADKTKRSLPARLAVEHCTHEARGLDVLPQTIHRFRSNGDADTAQLLEDVIYQEEITHCAAGVRWLKYLHAQAWDGKEWPWAPAPVTDGAAQSGLAAERPAACVPESPGALSVPESPGALSAPESPGALSAPESPGATKPPALHIPEWVTHARRYERVEAWFGALVREHFHGPLKPPFNEDARAQAGFAPEWYLPLAGQPKQAAEERDHPVTRAQWAWEQEGGTPADV